MIYLIAYRIDGKVGLAVTDGAFNGGEDLEQTKSLLPDYNRYHVAGGTWSTSATIYWMQFRPCVLAFNDMKEVEEALFDWKVLQSASIAGRGVYTILKPEYSPNIAFDPKLIDEGLKTAKPFYEK
jgi:hypothetical protein